MLDGRQDFWNIGYPMLGALVYLSAVIMAAAVGIALYRRVQIWRTGGPYDEAVPHSVRIRAFAKPTTES